MKSNTLPQHHSGNTAAMSSQVMFAL